MKYYFLLLLFFSQLSLANCEQASESCVPVGEWQFSLSLGAGVYTNPLNGGDNIPLILIPKISYYGENVFFENNTLGYSFFETDAVIVSAITQLNHENAFFNRWHPQNIILGSTTSSSIADSGNMNSDNQEPLENQTPNMNPDKTEVSLDDIPKKRWAIDSGIQVNWFIDQFTDVQLQILHDINGVYNGFNGQLQFTQNFKFDSLINTTPSYSFGASVNSKNLVDYFYGFSDKNSDLPEQSYQGKLSINPYFRFTLVHKFSSKWSAQLHIKRIFLNKATTDSPLVNSNKVDTVFMGVTYDF